jgi:hypothetical protein
MRTLPLPMRSPMAMPVVMTGCFFLSVAAPASGFRILYSTTRSVALRLWMVSGRACTMNSCLVKSIHGPLHVHGAPMALLVAVVFLDGGHTARDLQGLVVADAEAVALCALDGDGERGLTGFHTVHHLAVLVAELLLDDAAEPFGQRGLEHQELVRAHGALHHHLTKAVAAVDQHHVLESALGIEAEGHAAAAHIGTHHLLDAYGKTHLEVVVPEAFAVHDGAVGEERGEAVAHGTDQVLMAADVEEGLLLACE